MKLETEVLGKLNDSEFTLILADLENKLGKPEHIKRLSMQVTDFASRNLDTRIRITNGSAEIMQKIGNWDAMTREELSVSIASEIDSIYAHWQILSNILDTATVRKTIIQMESYSFKTPAFEIKLTHQFGSEDAYNFEVETFDEQANPLDICKEYSLEPDLEPKDASYWEDFNARVNLDVCELSKDDLIKIISSHIN